MLWKLLCPIFCGPSLKCGWCVVQVLDLSVAPKAASLAGSVLILERAAVWPACWEHSKAVPLVTVAASLLLPQQLRCLDHPLMRMHIRPLRFWAMDTRLTQSCCWIQSGPGLPRDVMAKDCVLHLPVLPLPTRNNATTAAGPAGWGRPARLWCPDPHPRACEQRRHLWCWWVLVCVAKVRHSVLSCVCKLSMLWKWNYGKFKTCTTLE